MHISRINATNNFNGELKSFIEAFGKRLEKVKRLIQSQISKLLLLDNEVFNNELTVLDVFILGEKNIKFFSENEILLLIKKLLKLKDNEILLDSNGEIVFNEETYIKINNIFNQSLKIFEQLLENEMLKSFFNTFKSIINDSTKEFCFNNRTDLIRFIYYSSYSFKSLAFRQIVCSLLKIAYVISLLDNHPEILDLDKIFEEIIKSNILSKFQNMSKNSECNSFDLVNLSPLSGLIKKFKLHGEYIPNNISFSGRAKSGNSTILKLIYNPIYSEVDTINDLYGIRVQVNTSQEAIHLLQYIFFTVFDGKEKLQDLEYFKNIVNKSLLTIELLESEKENLNVDFYNLLKKVLENSRNNPIANDKFSDIKIIDYVTHNGKPYSIEFSIVLVNNKNETGYAHHYIYDIKKIIFAMIRLQGYVSNAYIRKLIRRKLLKLQEKDKNTYNELLGLGNGDLDTTIENIFYHLTVSSKKLLRINIPGCSNKKFFYTSISRWNALRKNGLMPDGTQVCHELLTKGTWTNKLVKPN